MGKHPESDFYAHSLVGQPVKVWQPLREDLENVAEMAKQI